MKKDYMKIAIRLMLVLTIGTLALSGCDRINGWFGKTSTDRGEFVTEIQPEQTDGSVAMLLPDFTQLVERAGPTVVNIQAIRKDANTDDAGEVDPFLDYFKQIVPMPDMPQEGDDNVSFGSGFLISSDGYVITNTHVIKDSQQVKVTLSDKREFVAKIVGSDTQTDISLLKIDATDLPIIKVGSSKDLKVGEWVAAIGAPFGFDNSVTAGIVSAKNRSLPNENYTPFIQTDVAINPGNSGGPLFNLKGQVVGVNSQIYSRSGGFMGISFAIPIDIAMNIGNQLKTYGKVKRGQLGVVIQEVNYDLAKSFGLDKPRGALVVKVFPNGPAAQAKVQVGDIINRVNDTVINSASDLPMAIGIIAPGEQINMGVWRQGKEVVLPVTLIDMEKSLSQNQNDLPNSNIESDTNKFSIEDVGLSMTTLSDTELKSHNLDAGLLVLNTTGLAADSGVRRGDIILSVGQFPVKDESGLKKALAQESIAVPLYVLRGYDTLFLPLRLK